MIEAPPQVMEIVIEIFDKVKHQKSSFECFDESLTQFMRQFAITQQRKKFTQVYVITEQIEVTPKRILGYFTLANACFSRENLNEKEGRVPYQYIPTIKIGRLARDRHLTGKGFGEVLLLAAIKKCIALSTLSGMYAIEVNAINLKVAEFYKSYGFIPFQDDPLTLYIPIKSIADYIDHRNKI